MRWEEIRARVLPVEVRADPYHAIVLRLFPLSEDPFGLAEALRGTLLRLLAEDVPSERIMTELLRLVSESRRPSEVLTPGRLLRPEDFLRAGVGSSYVLIGDRPRLEDLVDGCFMLRPDRLRGVLDVLDPILDGGTGGETQRRTLPVVWIDGTSGSGKSVLLLQILEYLVLERDIPVHLLPPSSSQRLPEALEFWSRASRPGIIAVDDVYAPEGRQGDTWRRVHELSFEGRWVAPPLILTCGPSEYRGAFEEEVRRGGGLELIPISLKSLEADERANYSEWFASRTGQSIKTVGEANFANAAFLYHLQTKEGAADLGQFAQRLGDRLKNRGVLEEVLTVLRATSLGSSLPTSLFVGKEDDREALIEEGLLRLWTTQDDSQTFTFLHPKMARQIFDHLVPAKKSYARATYLTRCFLTIRADADRACAFVKMLSSSGILERERALALEQIWIQLAERNPPDLEIGIIGAWYKVANSAIPLFMHQVLGRISRWLECPSLDATSWGILWQILWDAWLPSPPEILVRSGREWLPKDVDTPPWCYVWERLWKFGEQSEEMSESAEVWLELHTEHAGWGYIFQALADSTWKRPALTNIGLNGLSKGNPNIADPYLWPKILALSPDKGEFIQALVSRLFRCDIPSVVSKGAAFIKSLCQDAEDLEFLDRALESEASRDLPAWSLVWRHLITSFGPAVPSSLLNRGLSWLSSREDSAGWASSWRCLLKGSETETEETWSIGRRWLSNRGDHMEWQYVWRDLLDLAASASDRRDLWTEGLKWLPGREDRTEWAHVWQRLLVDLVGSNAETRQLWIAGRIWLHGHEDRAEWSHVWKSLLVDSAGSEAETKELWTVGRNWLAGREDRAEWNYVWQRLLNWAGLASERRDDLWSEGRKWLSGREGRAEWKHVWQHLLDMAALSSERRDLCSEAWKWLPDREDRTEWSHVWRRLLLELTDSEKEMKELWSIGRIWLSGREDRADWNYVWQRLLNLASSSLERKSLWSEGRNWLSGREDRSNWNYVWQSLLNLADPALEMRDLWTEGRKWLAGREDRANWSYVWQHLFEMAQDDEVWSLYEVGFIWLRHREARADWRFVWQDLTQFNPSDVRLIDVASVWLGEERPLKAARSVQKRLAQLKGLDGSAIHPK